MEGLGVMSKTMRASRVDLFNCGLCHGCVVREKIRTGSDVHRSLDTSYNL